MFGWEFPPYISGGLGTACFGLTRSMASQGAQITFVLPKATGALGDNLPVDIVDASSVKIPSRMFSKSEISKNISYLEIDSLLGPYMTELTYSEKLAQVKKMFSEAEDSSESVFSFTGHYGENLIQEVKRMRIVGAALGTSGRYDIIHAHDWMTFPAGLAAKESSGLPLVVHVHATEFDRSGENVNQEIYDIERAGMHGADKIIAVSNRTKNILIEKYGIAEEKVFVVYNAVDKNIVSRDEYESSLEERLVLFLGRVTSQKGPFYFIDAADIVRKKIKNVRFVMAGTGDLLAKCIKRTAELRLQDCFHFTGFLTGDDISHMFSISDVLVMPSVSEPFGIVPYEAMNYEVPVIVSKQSGIAEVLDHAIKVDFWDTFKLADEIINVLNNTTATQKMIKDNAMALDKVHWDIPAHAVLSLYRNTIR